MTSLPATAPQLVVTWRLGGSTTPHPGGQALARPHQSLPLPEGLTLPGMCWLPFPVVRDDTQGTINCGKMSKQKKISHKIPFKLEVVTHAKERGNRAAETHFGPPPTDTMIREWRKQEYQLQKTDKTKPWFRGHAARWPQLEVGREDWIARPRNHAFRRLQKRSRVKPASRCRERR